MTLFQLLGSLNYKFEHFSLYETGHSLLCSSLTCQRLHQGSFLLIWQVQGLLNQMQEQFEKMAQTVVSEIDQLGARIDALESQVEGLSKLDERK